METEEERTSEREGERVEGRVRQRRKQNLRGGGIFFPGRGRHLKNSLEATKQKSEQA